jgi:hypothetical protein
MMPAKRAASAAAVVPPASVMNPARYVDANVVSNVASKVPNVVPEGNPVNVGVVVVTGPSVSSRFASPGPLMTWMCAALLMLVRPENETYDTQGWATGSIVTSATRCPATRWPAIHWAPTARL